MPNIDLSCGGIRDRAPVPDQLADALWTAGAELHEVCAVVVRALGGDERAACYLLAYLPEPYGVEVLGWAFGDGRRHGVPADTMSVAGSLFEWAQRSGRAVARVLPAGAIEHLDADALRSVADAYPIGPIVVAPLAVNGRDVGFLCVTRPPEAPPFGERDCDVLTAVSRQVALAAEHTSLRRTVSRSVVCQQALATIGEQDHRVPVDDLFALVCRQVREALDADVCALYSVGADGAPLRLACADGPAEVEPTLSIEPGVWHELAGRQVAMWLRAEARHDDAGVLPDAESSLAVMVWGPSGPAGVLAVGRITHRRFTETEARFVDAVGRLVDRTLVARDTVARLREQAQTDALTGLPNRALLAEATQAVLASAATTGASHALLVADLDGFKVVNDSLGHRAGDELLCAVAARLRAIVRPGDLVARLGGDEFAVLCVGADEAVAVAVGRRILASLDEPVDLDGSRVVPRVSVGVAVADPAQGLVPTYDALLPQADLAMYRAKADGRHRIAVYDVVLHEDVQRRLHLEHGLRAAIAGDELFLHFQPVVRLADGAVRALEALVRWQHPTVGLVRPDQFIGVAEDAGIIGDLTTWVLTEAARQSARWRAAGLLAGDQAVSVNLSAHDLHDPEFVDRVRSVLADTGCPPEGLAFEVTESVLTGAEGASSVRALRELGLGIALDDYGTGYSSLGQLKRLPVDVVKIDRSFVAGLLADPVDATIVASTINLAHALGKRVTAEGIETAEQLHVLTSLGCDAGQGYLLARPQAPAIVAGYLATGLPTAVAHLRPPAAAAPAEGAPVTGAGARVADAPG